MRDPRTWSPASATPWRRAAPPSARPRWRSPARAVAQDALGRLTRVARAWEAEVLERDAAALYEEPAALREDVLLLRALRDAPERAQQLLAMRAYAREATVPAAEPGMGREELAIDRAVALQRLSFAAALGAPQQVEALSADFDLFRRRYQRAYAEHHRSYYEQAAALRRSLQPGRSGLDALRRLNALPELGAPAGADLVAQYDRLLEAVRSCGLGSEALRATLLLEPACPQCGLRLDARPPADAIARWLEDLRAALRAQQRRLAQRMVGRAVGDAGQPAFERFLRATQAADVAPLVDVLDDEGTALIRDLLQEP